MGLIGAGVGAFCGKRWGILGALVGGVVGSCIENRIRSRNEDDPDASRYANNADAEDNADNRVQGMAVLSIIAALLAKMAKADGKVSVAEINSCEKAFARLGLSPEQRNFCIRCFNSAKNDHHTIYEYAQSFAQAQSGQSIREIVYDILWNLACADNKLSSTEMEILREIPAYLRINQNLFAWQCSQHKICQEQSARVSDEIDPYAVFGCTRNVTDEEIRKAFREKSKSMHPDILRSKGLPDELIQEATRQMTRINAAWNAIKQERGL